MPRVAKKTIRIAFIKRVRGQFYKHLRSYSLLQDWATVELYALTDSIIHDKLSSIHEFLDSEIFTLKDADKAASLILKNILLPEIEKLRI